MQITTLKNLERVVHKMVYKGHSIKLHTKHTLYICQPINYKNIGLRNLDIWSGFVVYYTNARSKKVGTYKFVLDKDNDLTYQQYIKTNPLFMKLCPFGINTILAKVQSEENCKAFPDKLVPVKLFTEENNKAIFDSRRAAEEYINKIKNGEIILPEVDPLAKMVITPHNENINNSTEEKLND